MSKSEMPINKATVTECSELSIDMGTTIAEKAVDDVYLNEFGKKLRNCLNLCYSI